MLVFLSSCLRNTWAKRRFLKQHALPCPSLQYEILLNSESSNISQFVFYCLKRCGFFVSRVDIEFIYNIADFSQYKLKIQVLVILSSRCVNIYVERLFSQAICSL